MKKIGLLITDLLAIPWLLLPEKLRNLFFTALLILDSRNGDPKRGLKRLFHIQDRLEWVINERAMVFGKGEHPKHRLTCYHSFFTNRINNGERVLDVGCGYGAVARSIAQQHPNSTVLGMDLNRSRLSQAQSTKNPPNLNFLLGDATQEVPLGGWDVVILSNVLEHIEGRIGFLRALREATMASRILIRVPLFERDWKIPLRRELGIPYFSDSDHKIEHQLSEFYAELDEAQLLVTEVKTLWGEIWADCRTQSIIKK
jgi:SAM-dependent methyltransferase